MIRKPPKPVIIGGLIAGGILAFVWWRNRSAVNAATSTTDPLTGLSTGAEANTGATGGNAGGGLGGLSDTVDVSGDTSGVHDVPTWTADVIGKLGGTYEPSALYAALGSYLAGQPINSDQAAMVRAAWAASGKRDFLPASYTLTTAGSTPGGGGATAPTPTTPYATVSGVRVSLSTGSLPGATSYEWAVNGADHAHTSGPTYVYEGKPHTTYRFSVRAVVNGHDTPQSGSTSATTKE